MKRCIVPILIAAATVTATASAPVFWQVSTQAEFLRGEVDALSVDDEGRLRLGPATDTVLETPEPALWSLARATDGALWMGSGTDGRLYRLGADGAGTVVLDADELDVHALAADRDGGVYAGTSPGGRVYRVTAGGGATVAFDPVETYIWAVEYEIDETAMTARQLWQSETMGPQRAISIAMGDVDWLPETENVLVAYGALLDPDSLGNVGWPSSSRQQFSQWTRLRE